jgi:hypothetical protein
MEHAFVDPGVERTWKGATGEFGEDIAAIRVNELQGIVAIHSTEE